MKNQKQTLLPNAATSKQRKLAHIFSINLHWLAFVCLLAFTACEKEDNEEPDAKEIQPSGPKPDWAPTIDPQMQAVVEQFLSFNTPPLPQLSVRQARMTPSMTDAVEALLMKNNIQPKAANVAITQRVIPSAPPAAPDGILVRIYTPQSGTGPFPVIVYYHGGGWVIANLDTYEPSAKALAEKAGAIVVSVDYRQAPENKFPAAHEDAFAAYKWVRENAAAIGGNPAKVAVAGESAGGNMAAAVCILARDRAVPLPVHQLLVYPVANNDLTTPSYNMYANAQPLNRPLVQWFVANYFNSPADGDNPLISLVDVANLSGLPSATIIGAEIDPLMSEGKQLADKLQQSGVTVTYQNYVGVTHEFFGMNAVLEEAEQAQQLAADELKKAFQQN